MLSIEKIENISPHLNSNISRLKLIMLCWIFKQKVNPKLSETRSEIDKYKSPYDKSRFVSRINVIVEGGTVPIRQFFCCTLIVVITVDNNSY